MPARRGVGRLLLRFETGFEYPQAGQPPLKVSTSPLKPQEGQRIAAKNLPQRGHRSALAETSSPQPSQKKRGFFFFIVFNVWF
jgi:hypothetical protein